MITLGYILFYAGCLIGLSGEVMFLVIARRHGPWCFWGCLLLPPVWLAFFFMSIKATWKPVVLSLLGLFTAGVGAQLAGINWPD